MRAFHDDSDPLEQSVARMQYYYHRASEHFEKANEELAAGRDLMRQAAQEMTRMVALFERVLGCDFDLSGVDEFDPHEHIN